jgi:DNA-binding phage protein
VSTPLFKNRDRRARTSRLALQALHRQELTDSGRRIQESREAAQRELDRIAAFLPGARHAGMTMTEISQLTGLSRPTLYELQNRSGTVELDVTLAVLSALGGLGPQTAEQLSGVTKIAEQSLAQALEDLVARELVSVALGYYTAGTQTAFVMLTEAGVGHLHTLLSRPR